MTWFRIPYTYNVIRPLVYDDSVSLLQMVGRVIARLNERDDDLAKFLTISQFTEFVNFIESDQKTQTETLKDYTDEQLHALDVTLRALLADIVAGQVVLQNPTFGQYPQPIQTVIYDIYDWLSDYGSYNATDYDAIIGEAYTAQEIDALDFSAFDHDLYSRTRIMEA